MKRRRSNAVVYVRAERLLEEDGLWCPTCLLPSVTRMVNAYSTEDGSTLIGTSQMVACMEDCGYGSVGPVERVE